MKKFKGITSIFIVFIIICITLSPKLYIEACLSGISVWATTVLPCILPFIFFTKMLASFGVIEKCSAIFEKPCKLFFNTSPLASFAFLSSIISGYPIGASITVDLYENGKISKKDAFKMSSFCSTSGPMFILGAVGVSMLGNIKLGYIILISHILGAIINGLLYRNCNLGNTDKHIEKSLPSPQTKTFSDIILECMTSVLSVGNIIAIFFVIITSLSPIFNIFPPAISSCLEGLIEITKGCSSISQNLSGLACLACATFIITFGGFSTILQSYSLLSKIKMPLYLFILQKISHATISTTIALLLGIIFI